MNTNAVELQAYVNSMGADPWYEKTGMLGMGLFGSCVASIALFLIILYIIGVISQYREKKTWLVPGKRYWLEIGRAGAIWVKSWIGIATPRAMIDRGDSKYMRLTREMLDYGLLKADEVMSQIGATYPGGYMKKAFDCENFARLRAQLASFYISRHYGIEGFGVPVGTVGYSRDGKDPHEDVQALLDGSTILTLINAYPYGKEIAMSEVERDSINFDVI